MHAAIQFTQEYPHLTIPWYTKSNYLVALVTNDETTLCSLLAKAAERGIVFSIFREPDLADQVTAACFEPSQATQKLLSKLQLLLNK
jgi:hypothetical protein